MKIIPSLLIGLACVAAPMGTMASPSPPTADPAHELARASTFDVIGLRLHVTTKGPRKGTMLARVKVRYHHPPATATRRWFGETTITLKGPGGSKTVRDIDRLKHAGTGQIVDHRVVVSRREAARILGRRGAKAKVRVTVRGRVTPGSAAEHQLTASGGGEAFVVGVVGTGSWPPPARTWGEESLAIGWTLAQPYLPYFTQLSYLNYDGSFILVRAAYDAQGHPLNGFVSLSDGSFSATNTKMCGQPTVTGKVPVPVNGVFPDTPWASVGWTFVSCSWPLSGTARPLLPLDPLPVTPSLSGAACYPSCAGADLSFHDMSNMNMTGADLRTANLTAARMRGTNLTDANLAGANLGGADLTGANLTRANFTGAWAYKVNFSNATLRFANLTDANVTDSNIYSAADLTGVVWSNTTGA